MNDTLQQFHLGWSVPKAIARAVPSDSRSWLSEFKRRTHTMGILILISSIMPTPSVQAQTDALSKGPGTETPVVSDQATDATFPDANWPAHKAVRAGNKRLIEGDPAAALQAYRYAEELEPDAPQIPFVEGLAYYAQQDYEAARRLFERAATAEDAKLANDALYSLGTTYHAQALQQEQDPQAAIEHLEQALQRYRLVLDQDPHHEQARDANRKAAAMRRQLREMMQQQQQEQQSQSDNQEKKEDENQENQDQENQDQSSSDGEQEENDQQQASSEDNDQQQASQQDDSSDDAQEDKQESQSADKQDQQDDKKQQASAKQQEESESSKQAKRQLREMMQALRDRKKIAANLYGLCL